MKKGKVRSIRELLTIMRDREQLFNDNKCSELCYFTTVLLRYGFIGPIEHDILIGYIRNHRPMKGIHCDKEGLLRNSGWYWESYKWKPRKAWLDSRLKLKNL
jgi:hypothetical protein